MGNEDKQYRQCSLSKPVGTGRKLHMAFLPTEFAKVGRIVGLKFGDEWVEGWRVDSVGPVRTVLDVDLARGDHKRFQWVLGDSK